MIQFCEYCDIIHDKNTCPMCVLEEKVKVPDANKYELYIKTLKDLINELQSGKTTDEIKAFAKDKLAKLEKEYEYKKKDGGNYICESCLNENLDCKIL